MKNCGDCTNGYIGVFGIHCIEFNELINNELVAEECPAYTPFEELISKPAVPTDVTPTSLEMVCYDYLSGLHSTLWSQHFEIKTPAGREEAAKWLASCIHEVIKSK